MAGNAGGRSSVEDIEGRSCLALVAKARRLQLEHRPVATARRHQPVVRAELDHLAVLQHADAIGVAHRREAVRDQDRRGVARSGEDTVEDLRLTADVELGRGLVEQHQPGAEPHGAQRSRQGDALPLADRKSTRLNSSHRTISYAVFCLKKKKKKQKKTAVNKNEQINDN